VADTLKSIPNFLGGGILGRSAYVTAQERLNCYIDMHREQENSDRDRPMAIYGTPGETLFTSFGQFPCRGIYGLGNLLYVVNQGTLFSVNNAGTQTALGTLQTMNGRVFMQDNGLGNQLSIYDGKAGYIWNTNTLTFSTIVDGNFPNGTTTGAFQDTFMIAVNPTGQTFTLSQPGAAQTWTPVLAGVAESAAGQLLRVMSVNSQLVLLGTKYTEWWQDTGALNFPYQRIPGAASNWGLAAANSPQLFMDSLAYLARTPEGAVTVVWMNGFLLQQISTPELDWVINNYAITADATGVAYKFGGHSFYQLNFPSAGQSWLYDGHTKKWSKVQSGVQPGRQNMDMVTNIFNQIMVADASVGNVYQLDANNFTENGGTIIREIVSRHVFDDFKQVQIDVLQIDMDTGIGLNMGQGSTPTLIVSISKDGGNNWQPEIWVPLGAIGVFTQRAILRRLGRGRDWTFKLRLSDPCKWAVTGSFAEIRVNPR